MKRVRITDRLSVAAQPNTESFFAFATEGYAAVRSAPIHISPASMKPASSVYARPATRTLAMPKLILHALQVNVRGGRLPEPEANGRRYLKFPLDALEGAAW
jgi:hypothetical protein